MKQRLAQDGSIYVVAMIVVLIFVVGSAGLTIFAIFHTSKSSQTVTSDNQRPSGNLTNSFTILSPAAVPPKTAECSQAISFQSNGNSGPIQCANGDLNTTEWKALSALEPSVMSLGYNPSISQLQADLCSDAAASSSDANTKNSYLIETTVYQISALYYGWSFSPNPSAILTNNGCG